MFGAYGDAELVHAGDALYLPLWSMFLINFTECIFLYVGEDALGHLSIPSPTQARARIAKN